MKREILKKAMNKEYCGKTRFDYLDKEEKPMIYKAMGEYHQAKLKLFSINIVSKSIATQYAEFCVRCDREKIPLLELDDYIKHYCC